MSSSDSREPANCSSPRKYRKQLLPKEENFGLWANRLEKK
jgi:hypothetical protein